MRNVLPKSVAARMLYNGRGALLPLRAKREGSVYAAYICAQAARLGNWRTHVMLHAAVTASVRVKRVRAALNMEYRLYGVSRAL